MQCKWTEAWVGQCKKESDESGFCEEHRTKECVSCGKQATRNCDQTGQFVCGAPLCDECEHTVYPSGTNGGIGFFSEELPEGMKSHCKKSEQKFKPWYMKDLQKGEAGDIQNR